LVYKTGKIGIYKRYIPLFIRAVEAYKGNKDIKKKKISDFSVDNSHYFFCTISSLSPNFTPERIKAKK
jgi:hypothetical protein